VGLVAFLGIEAAMSNRKKYGFASFGVGLVLAILFFILSGTDDNNSGAYIGAAITCVVAGVAGLIIALTASS
jgi:hypothetical protein